MASSIYISSRGVSQWLLWFDMKKNVIIILSSDCQIASNSEVSFHFNCKGLKKGLKIDQLIGFFWSTFN